MSLCSPNVQAALTHRSWASENGGNDYEKLELLGDSVLQLCVTQLLYGYFKDANEGQLSKMRHRLVNNERLAAIASNLKIGQLIRFGNGEIRQRGHKNPKILSNVFEALLGALYLDFGLIPVQNIVNHHFTPFLKDANVENPKSKLHEWVQQNHKTTPNYEIVEQSGPAHRLRFKMSVCIDGKSIATGTGKSKQLASKNAAVNALRLLGLKP